MNQAEGLRDVLHEGRQHQGSIAAELCLGLEEFKQLLSNTRTSGQPAK